METENHRSLHARIADLLSKAQVAHELAVKHGNATDADWPIFYAGYLCVRLRPILSGMQATVPVAHAHTHTEVFDDGPGWFAQLSGLADETLVK